MRTAWPRQHSVISAGAPVKAGIFTFIPSVRTLPVKCLLAEEDKFEAFTGISDKDVAVSHERTAEGNMSDGHIFKAKINFIKDIMERGPQNTGPLETKPKWKPPENHVSPTQTNASPSGRAQSENTPNRTGTGTVTMETAVDQHWGNSRRQSHDTSGRAEVILGCFLDKANAPDDRASPVNSADMFSTPASSRESILSEGSDKKSWVAMQHSSVTSPASFSRTVSPCSSVRSGVFSPAVVQVRKHFLAPGSSLLHNPQTCFSSCDSLSSSACPRTPPPRHRPPLTRLSLLTAILRKGRLPVLSPALHRPYTPCWPVNPVTLSFCNACSAASSVASIPLEFSSRFSSSASIDQQNQVYGDASNCITPTPAVEAGKNKEMRHHTQATRCKALICSDSEPRQERVISPPPKKSNMLFRTHLPLFSNLKSVSSPNHEKPDSPQHGYISKVPELNSSDTRVLLQDHADNNVKKLISQSSQSINEPETSVPPKWTSQSSLSRLNLLSQKLRSPPVAPPLLRPSQSHGAVSSACSDTAWPLRPLQNNTWVGGWESERSCAVSRSCTPSQGSQKAHCLSPSRYTPIAFSGWPSPSSTPTPTPSPAPPLRDFTPSPSRSLCSTPLSRPGSGMSDWSDREGKKAKTYRIKLGYKSLAAIPTNNLLLEQQVIDEQVDKDQSNCNPLKRCVKDTHEEMCSPAQFHQRSQELCAAIDEILANSVPAPSTTRAPFQLGKSSLQKSLGRETKYASVCSLHPTPSKERKLMDPHKTKPGVIRPMTAIPRLNAEAEDEYLPNSFRQFVKQNLPDRKKVENVGVEESQTDVYTNKKGKILSNKRKSDRSGSFPACELHIKEPDEQISHLGKGSSSCFSATEKRMEAYETHI
ncbi:uncharacterized protein mlip isoform 1-T1 [Menidia menidia]